MTTIRITPARERFLVDFDRYTNNGRNPHTLDGVWKEFKTQCRVVNYCKRNGLLAKSGLSETYIVSLEAKRLAGIVTASLDTIVRRRTKKRSSADPKANLKTV